MLIVQTHANKDFLAGIVWCQNRLCILTRFLRLRFGLVFWRNQQHSILPKWFGGVADKILVQCRQQLIFRPFQDTLPQKALPFFRPSNGQE